jgi:hypothetical protein
MGFFSLADQYPQLFKLIIFPCPFPIYELELNMNRMSLFSEAHICVVCKNLFSPTRKDCHMNQYIFYTEW